MSTILTPRDQEMACYIWQSMKETPEVSYISFVAVHGSSPTILPSAPALVSRSLAFSRCTLRYRSVSRCSHLPMPLFSTLRAASSSMLLLFPSPAASLLHITRCELIHAAYARLTIPLLCPLHVASSFRLSLLPSPDVSILHVTRCEFVQAASARFTIPFPCTLHAASSFNVLLFFSLALSFASYALRVRSGRYCSHLTRPVPAHCAL